jgi:hypothetical protein
VQGYRFVLLEDGTLGSCEDTLFFSRASIPVSVFRLENPIYKKIALLSLLTPALAAQAISAAANGVTYKVRLDKKMGRFGRETFELV